MLLSNDGFRDARVRREASALAGAGHEVTIFALASDRTVETEWVEGFRFRRIAPRRTGPALLWNVLLWPWHFAELAHAADREWSFDAVHAHDLDILEPARFFEHPDMVENELSAPDRKGWNDHCPAAPGGACNHVTQLFHGIELRMSAISIGRLYDDVIGILHRLRVKHERVVIAAKVTRKDNGFAAPTDFNGRCPKNMPGAA